MYDYTTPYVDVLPPLSTAEHAALTDDIAANGQRWPIIVDAATGDVIDGHHRLAICRELGIVPAVVEIEEAWPRAAAIRLNTNRRNLSPEQRAELRTTQQAVAAEMREAGATQEEIGLALGVARETVKKWFSNGTGTKAKHDQRVTIPPGARPEIVARVESGERLAQVASDYGVSIGRVSQIVNAEKAKAAETDARQALIDDLKADVEGDGWKLLHGDFRERLLDLEAGSVDLIVTDPPYPAESLPLWGDLAEIAAKVLRPQGVLCGLTGNIFLPDVTNHLSTHLSYGWVYCQPLPGSQSRIMGRHVLQSWKPWLAFSNGPWPSGRIDWHPDTLDPSIRAKDRYRWEQDPDPVKLLIDTFTDEGGVVLDPFTGTGSYGVAALEMGRQFVGVEMDGDRFTAASDRLVQL